MAITTRRMARQAEEAEEALQGVSSPAAVPRTPEKSIEEALIEPTEAPEADAPRSPLPRFWYTFFGIVEPVSTFSGAAMALLAPANFYHDLVPAAFVLPGTLTSWVKHVAPVVTPPPAGAMAVAQLGSCYLLLTLNSAVFFYTVKKHVKDLLLLQTLVQAVLTVLAIADWIHIAVTLLYLPTPVGAEEGLLPKLEFLLQPASWNALLFGNVVITFILFLFRAAWLAGFARAHIDVAQETPVPPTPKRGRPRKNARKTPKFA